MHIIERSHLMLTDTSVSTEVHGREQGTGSVRRAVERSLQAGVETGIQIAAYLNGELVIDVWGGYADPISQLPVAADTLFNVFSVGKPFVSVATYLQIARGLFDLDTKIVEIWPEYGVNGKDETTVAHVLTHRSGVPHMPPGVTPDSVGDWEEICAGIAGLNPLFPPGSRTAYQALTFGWILGEIVRRTDVQQRSFSNFVADEIMAPLGIHDSYFGAPDRVHDRIARLSDANGGASVLPPNPWREMAMPAALALVPAVFELPQVRRASIPAVGMITNARNLGRFWAMLAAGGELNGRRLFSRETVEAFGYPRPASSEPDPIMYGVPLWLSDAGFWLAGDNPRACSLAGSPRAIWHPGAGGSIGWSDPDTGLAVAICHNRMFNAPNCASDPIVGLSNAIRQSLSL